MRWLWNIAWIVGPLGATVLALFLLVLYCGLPDVGALSSYEKARVTRILARDGQVVATLFLEKRSPVKLDQVSPLLVKALLAVEDSRFYQHHGVDFWGVGRAFFANTVQGRVDQGASTLTMQLARHRFLNQDLSYIRKVREMMLAMQIENRFSKEKILEFYLNNVYFGSGAYGVATASKVYFGRPPGQLSLGQSALLAGVVQAPSSLSPLVDREAALKRTRTVLDRMLALGQIDGPARDAAWQQTQKFKFAGRYEALEPLLKHPYFTTFVISHLARDYPEESLYSGGLKVNTTLDVRLQRLAESELSATMNALGPGVNADSAALVLIENSTGSVRAMVGGRGWSKKNQFNRAWQALRQPGSSFKPFVYAVALQNGYTPDTLVEDRPIRLGDWSPKNSDGRYRGTITLRQALRESRNVVAARLCSEQGASRVAAMATALGILDPLTANLSIALGSCEVSPLSMASAYSSIASGGFYRPPLAIARVLSADDRVLLDNRKAQPRLVLDPSVCGQLVDMMMGVVEGGTGTAARLPGVEVAGKTGTTDQSRDAWFVGFTPEYTLAVWVGNDDHSPMWDVYGGGLPAIIWRRVMGAIPQPQTRFPFVRKVKPVVLPRTMLESEPTPEEPVEEMVEEEALPPIEPWETPTVVPDEEPEAVELVEPTPVESTPAVEQ